MVKHTSSLLVIVESETTLSLWEVNFDEENEYFYPSAALNLEDYGFEFHRRIADIIWSEPYLAVGGISGGQSVIEIWYIQSDSDSTIYLDRTYFWEFELDEVAFEGSGAYVSALDREAHVIGFWNNYL